MGDQLLRTADEFRAGYRQVLENVEQVAGSLDAEAFERPTGCPGWSVHDCVAHVAALESLLIGREHPSHQPPDDLPHVRDSMGAFMEVGVDLRRGWSQQQVLDEYREVMAERLQRLDRISDADLDADAPGIFGTSKLRNILRIRVFDIWSHEQDIRRATGQPGGFDGAAGRHARASLARGVGNRIAERAAPPQGTTLLLDITAPEPSQFGIVFADGAGRVAGTAPDHPTVTLRLDMNTLTVLGCGRSDAPEARRRVELGGEAALAASFVEDLGFTP